MINAVSILPQPHRAVFLTGDEDRIRKALASVQDIAALAPRLVALGGTAERLARAEVAARPLRAFLAALQTDGRLRAFDPATRRPLVPFEYQTEAAHQIFTEDLDSDTDALRTSRLLLWPTGAGKSTGANMVIAAAYLRAADAFKALYVVPIASVANWKREIAKWLSFPQADVLVAEKRQDLTEKAIAAAKIIITTHSCVEATYREYMHRVKLTQTDAGGREREVSQIMRMDKPTSAQLRQNPAWDADLPPPIPPLFNWIEHATSNVLSAVVWDEAELLRNAGTFSAHAAREVFSKSAYGIVLSATPIGNRPAEWASIINCMATNVDGSERFGQTSTYLTQWGNLSQAAIRHCHEALVHLVTQERLALPPKSTISVTFDAFVHPDGNTAYNSFIEEAMTSFAGYETDGEPGRNPTLMKCINGLEQGAFHHILMNKTAKRFGKQDVEHCASHPSNSMQMLLKTVRELHAAGRNRILIYCPHSTVNKISVEYLGLGGVKTYAIDGSCSSSNRDSTVKKFLASSEKSTLFITTAGSTALNIDNGCETVILYGPSDWSPASETQAIGRVYRVTQPREVLVVNLKPRDSASFLKQTEAQGDKTKRLLPAFHSLDFTSLYKKRKKLGWVAEDDASEDESGESKGAKESWRKCPAWAKAIPLLDTDGNPPYSVQTQEAAQGLTLATAPEGTEEDVLCFLRGQKRASEYQLPVFPGRGVDRFA